MIPRAEQTYRLLVVDDNRAIHGDFRKILIQNRESSKHLDQLTAEVFGPEPTAHSRISNGFQLDSAYQGKDGLALVEQAVGVGAPYAVAFIDVRMPPGWDGVETTAKIWEVDPDLQVVICTAYSDFSWQT